MAEVDTSFVALEEQLIFGEIVYDLSRCWLDHRVRIFDESHDEIRLIATRWSGHDRSEGMSEGQHDDDDCRQYRRHQTVVETAAANCMATAVAPKPPTVDQAAFQDLLSPSSQFDLLQ